MVAGAFDEDSILREPAANKGSRCDLDVSTAPHTSSFERLDLDATGLIKATGTRLNDQFASALTLSRDGDTLRRGAVSRTAAQPA